MELNELLRRIYSKDRETLYANLHDEFVVHSPGTNLIAGEKVGKEAFKQHIETIYGLTDGTFTEDLQGTFLANDTWGLVVHRMTADRGEHHLDTWGFGIWRRGEDGLLTDHWEAVGDQRHWDAFWS